MIFPAGHAFASAQQECMCFGFGVDVQVCVTHALACLAHLGTHAIFLYRLLAPLPRCTTNLPSPKPPPIQRVAHSMPQRRLPTRMMSSPLCHTSVPGVCMRYTSLYRAGLNRWWGRGCIYMCWRLAPGTGGRMWCCACAKLPCAHPVRISQCVYVTACGKHVTGVLKRVCGCLLESSGSLS